MRLERMLEALRTVRTDGAGVRDWSLYASESVRSELGVKDRHVGNAHAPLALNESCGARYKLIWNDDRISQGFLERSRLEADPVRSLEWARLSAYDDPDAAWVPRPEPLPEVALFDPEASAAARGDTALLTRRLASVRRLLSARSFRTWSGSFAASDSSTRLVISTGIDQGARGTSIGWHLTLDGELGDGWSGRAPESDADFEARVDRLADLAERLRGPVERVDGGMLPVILHPNVVREYVLDTLLSNLAGSTVAHGDGHFRRELFGSGRPALREDLTLWIDPLLPLRAGAYRFTTEGVPAARCTFIERGCLVRPVLDLKYARRLGLDPTPLPAAMDTLFLEGPPRLALTEALERAEGGALVLSVLGAHTQDSASGDFSLSAPQTLGVRSGALSGRLRATISGNLFEILSSEPLRLVSFEGEHTPGLLVRCRLDAA